MSSNYESICLSHNPALVSSGAAIVTYRRQAIPWWRFLKEYRFAVAFARGWAHRSPQRVVELLTGMEGHHD